MQTKNFNSTKPTSTVSSFLGARFLLWFLIQKFFCLLAELLSISNCIVMLSLKTVRDMYLPTLFFYSNWKIRIVLLLERLYHLPLTCPLAPIYGINIENYMLTINVPTLFWFCICSFSKIKLICPFCCLNAQPKKNWRTIAPLLLGTKRPLEIIFSGFTEFSFRSTWGGNL